MPSNPSDPFADMEIDWENTEKAKPGMSTGRLPVHHAYRGVCVAFDDGQGNMVDHQLLTPAGKNPGIKISIEILEPEKIEEETVKGRTHEHVFWVSGANWPYVKRDAETVLGVDPKNPKELLSAVWAGRTVEFGLKDDNYGGFLRSKVSHFNAWAPEKQKANGDAKKTSSASAGAQTKTAAKPVAGAGAAKTDKKKEAAPNVDF